MPVTVEQARYNLRTAARNVAARLELDPTALTHNQRRDYNRAFAAEILRYPQSFTPEILAIAGGIRDQGALAAETSWGDFAGEVLLTTAAASVPVLGGFTNKLFFGAVIVAVVWVVVKNWPPGPRTA